MKIPKRIQPLIDDGLVDEVLRQLMSGKEATVFMVRCGTQIRCAKVYKDVHKRSFKQAAQYQEGRK
ncbi:MAG: serine protein kinase RIO, partial [OM182 bacterium]